MMRPYALLALVCLIASLLSGCARIIEIDETAFVFSITFDKGEQAAYKIGTRVPVPRLLGRIQGQLAAGEGQEPYVNTQVETASLADAIIMTQLFTGRDISLDHVRTILFSEELARENIENLCQPLLRGTAIRGTTLLYIIRGNAFRFIDENQPILEVNTSKFIELVSREQSVHGLTVAMPISKFYAELTAEGAAVIPLASINETVLTANKAIEREPGMTSQEAEADRQAKAEPKQDGSEEAGEEPPLRTVGSYLPGNIPRAGGNAVEFSGLAVFKEDRMVGILNDNGALVYNMVRDNFRRTVLTVKLPDDSKAYVSLLVYRGRKPNIRVEREGARYKISVHLVVDCDIETLSTGQRIKSLESLHALEESVEQQLQHWIEATISETQQWSADVFGFGTRLRAAHLTWNEWEKFDWAEAYKNAEISVAVDANLRRTGLIIGSHATH